MLKKGDKAPDFSLESDDGRTLSLKDFAGKKLILYFYPKDNTSGCTAEALEFTALADSFGEEGAAVAGVSPDSVKSHINFREKHGLKIVLLSDPDKTACQAYDVWKEKSMYGRKYMGVLRSTFLISPDGIIEEALYNVKPKGHAEAVLCELKK